MHSGFQALREHCPMNLLGHKPKARLPKAVADNVRRIAAIWQDCRSRHGAGGPYLLGRFSAADAMYAPVASRFRTYVPDLTPYGDDGTAQAYVDAVFALPEMAEWESGARAEVEAAMARRDAGGRTTPGRR
jgi:glutathione S-transferase